MLIYKMYSLLIWSVLYNYVLAEEAPKVLKALSRTTRDADPDLKEPQWRESQSQHIEDNSKAVDPLDKSTITTTCVNPWHQHFWNPPKTTPHNVTYFDKAENLIRMPDVTKYKEEKLIKQSKGNKKYSKRTVQKIIKKSKQKIKKMYVRLTSRPTTKKDVNDKLGYIPDDSKDDITTPPPRQKKKPKKWNTKIARYPMPFQRHKNFKRDKRDDRELYIIKDFDEMRFLRQKKDYSVVNAHVKKYW